MAHRKKACIEHKQTYSKFRNCSSKHYSLQETGRGDNATSWRLKIKNKFWNSQKIIRLGALKSDSSGMTGNFNTISIAKIFSNRDF